MTTRIRLCHLYPDQLNIYADRGNIAVLRRRAERRGYELEWIGIGVGEALAPDCDLIYLGGGQDREQALIAPDLARFGFRFPQSYREIRVDPALFDWSRERERQARSFSEWKNLMPRAAAKLVGKPAVLAAGEEPCPVPFSRLTLTAQLEVLAQPVERSWERCAPLNPFLNTWRARAVAGRLLASPWPRSACWRHCSVPGMADAVEPSARFPADWAVCAFPPPARASLNFGTGARRVTRNASKFGTDSRMSSTCGQYA